MSGLLPQRDAAPVVASRGLVLARVLEVLLTLGLGAAVFGGVIPFTLIATHVLPARGLANVVYVIGGGVLGLMLGGLGAWGTLRGGDWIPRRWALFIAPLALALLGAMAASRWLDAFAHV